MDLSSLLAAYLSLASGHTLGHLDVANKTGAPANINWSNMSEEWDRPKSELIPIYKKQSYSNAQTKKNWTEQILAGYKENPNPSLLQSERYGGGFSLQDKLASQMNTPESYLANALYKGGYLLGNPLGGSTKEFKSGDIGGIAKNSGISEDKVKALLGVSVIADLVRANRPDDKWNVRFHAKEGNPGLMFDWRF